MCSEVSRVFHEDLIELLLLQFNYLIIVNLLLAGFLFSDYYSDMRVKSIIANLSLSLFSVVFVLLITEMIFRIFSPAQPSINSDEDLYPIIKDPNVGYKLKPNSTHRAIKRSIDEGVCYDVTYKIDKHGRRVTRSDYSSNGKPLLLFGCSVTMGEGLKDEDTLDFYLSQRLTSYNIYNFSVSGYGPSHILASLQNTNLSEQINNKNGISLFMLIPAHVSRVIADTRTPWIWENNSPYYDFNYDNQLIRYESFKSYHPLKAFTYSIFVGLKKNSRLLSYSNINFPLKINESHVKITVAILKEIEKEYNRQLDGKFYVVFHPTWTLGNPEIKQLYDYFTKNLANYNLSVLDYSRMEGLHSNEHIKTNCDEHPNGLLNNSLANQIANNLNG